MRVLRVPRCPERAAPPHRPAPPIPRVDGGASPRDELQSLTKDYPERWSIEEFFKSNQALGWQRTGTLNLNVRYGQMTMSLIAHAAIHQLRLRLGQPAAD